MPVTASGIKIFEWREWLLSVHKFAGQTKGLAICDDKGFLMLSRDMNNCFWHLTEVIWVSGQQSLFLSGILLQDDIKEKYNINRCWRRSSESWARAMKVSPGDWDAINGWVDKCKEKGKRPIHKLRVAYADQERLKSCFEWYNFSM